MLAGRVLGAARRPAADHAGDQRATSAPAATISEHLLAGGGLRALAGCDAGEACARKLIASFAARAYRRPLQAEEVAILEEAYRAGHR